MQGWSGLSLGQAVDTVIVDDIGHVNVPPSSVHEMSDSNSQPVTVSSDRNYFQIWIGKLSALRIAKHPSMQRVHSEGIGEVDKFAGAPDSGEKCNLVDVNRHLGQRHFQGGFDAEVSASGTPVVVDVRLEVGELKRHVSKPLSDSVPDLRRLV